MRLYVKTMVPRIKARLIAGGWQLIARKGSEDTFMWNTLTFGWPPEPPLTGVAK